MRNSRGHDLLIVGLLFIPIVALSVDAKGKVAIEAIAEAKTKEPPKYLCSDDLGTRSLVAPIPNYERKTFQKLIGITPASISIRYQSNDWGSFDEIENYLLKILHARPRNLSSIIDWSEGADFRQHSFIAIIQTTEKIEVRLEVSGYQICGSDSRGQYWYFRNVPVDVWP